MSARSTFEDSNNQAIKKLLREKIGSSPQNWSNMSTIEIADRYYWFASADTTKSSLIRIVKSLWNDIAQDSSSSVKCKKRAEQLMQTIGPVVNSRPAEMVFLKNIKQQSKDLLKSQLVQEELDGLTGRSVAITSTAAILEQTASSAPKKKRKYLKPIDLRASTPSERIKTLATYYGGQNMLNLCKANTIPKRFKGIVKEVYLYYKMHLTLRLMEKEHDMIKAISICRTKQDLYATVESINPFTNDSELPYVKLATQKLCHLLFANVLKTDHNEVWYRANVYGDTFDYIFSVKSGYEAKRSECHSTIVKSLKAMGFLPPDQQNVKLDFIFFHLATSNDGLVCEDKPTEKESSKDRKKVEDLRQKSLQYWQHMLPFDECIHHLTAVSCQFSRLKVKICGTKLIDGVTVHTTLKEATIPMEENDGASWAEYLSTIISLVRLVTHNLDILRLMTDVAKEDDIAFASTSSIMDNQFRENSPESIDSSDSRETESNTTTSDSNMNWIDRERKLRILEKIDVALTKYNEENDSLYVNPSWEDIFLEQRAAADDNE